MTQSNKRVGHLSAVVASCAMSTAAATNNSSNIDDILAVARKFPRTDRELEIKIPSSSMNADELDLQNLLLDG